MLVLVAYDINTVSAGGSSRARRINKLCGEYGKHVQYSLYECMICASQYREMRQEILDIIDEKQDSVRIYNLGNTGRMRVQCLGQAQQAFEDCLMA